MTWQAWVFAGLWLWAVALYAAEFRLNKKILDLSEELLDAIRREKGGDL